nr:PREDICTED: RUN and SH3 domain-containing protein 1 [Struthio camelus australis]
MLAPKKGLLCNLNHIHLQHISLGLHLSRHPELRETSVPVARGDRTDCGDCRENCGQVDANSNNPSLRCQCCEAHAQPPAKLGLQNQTAQEDFPCLHAGEDVASPCDPASTSSSVSSCSDFSLDDSPVSVYCKEFAREEPQYPEKQPDIIPIDDAQEDPLLADPRRRPQAQLGDSWLSPEVGYLLLHTLCPALYALVEDGLKPFQKDVITGQRKNSPWSVVEASVKAGPSTRSLHSLCWHVSRLAPLSSTRQRFHAFILGLLNIKQLELWISQLQKSPGVISMLYFPTAFFALSQGPLPHLADELLLLIQPLSVLTFHLDLLFEHHHLSVDVRPLSRRLESPPCPARRPSRRIGPLPAQARGVAQPRPEGQSSAEGASLECEIPPGHLGRAAPKSAEGSTTSQSQAAVPGPFPSPQVGAALQQTLQHVLRWGDQLSRTFLGADSPPENFRQGTGPQDAAGGLSGWWGQLSQASRIYVAPSKEGFPFIRWTKLRTAAGDASPGQTARPQASASEPRGTELQLLQAKAVTEHPSPDPISSAGSSRASSPEDLFLPPGARASTKPAAPAAGEKLLSASPEPCANGNQAAPSNPAASSPPGPEKGGWLGRLFGATCPPARGFPLSPDTTSARPRRPSSWLSPSMTALAVVMKGGASEKTHAQEQPAREPADQPQTPRAVRALCDHTGAAVGKLSFRKGDILRAGGSPRPRCGTCSRSRLLSCCPCRCGRREGASPRALRSPVCRLCAAVTAARAPSQHSVNSRHQGNKLIPGGERAGNKGCDSRVVMCDWIILGGGLEMAGARPGVDGSGWCWVGEQLIRREVPVPHRLAGLSARRGRALTRSRFPHHVLQAKWLHGTEMPLLWHSSSHVTINPFAQVGWVLSRQLRPAVFAALRPCSSCASCEHSCNRGWGGIQHGNRKSEISPKGQ